MCVLNSSEAQVTQFVLRVPEHVRHDESQHVLSLTVSAPHVTQFVLNPPVHVPHSVLHAKHYPLLRYSFVAQVKQFVLRIPKHVRHDE
jgi:hypothetical protein